MKNLKKLLALLIFTVSTNSYSSISVTQPDKFGGNFINNNGNVIELSFKFLEPVKSNESVYFYINNNKILTLTNNTNTLLERFLGRFRFNKDETLTIKTDKNTVTFKPNVISDIDLKDVKNVSQKHLTRIISDTLKNTFPTTNLGDCIFLINGISNTGESKPEKFIFDTNFGKVSIDSSDRVSGSILFSIGFDKIITSCNSEIK
jgi:hypothetical protein